MAIRAGACSKWTLINFLDHQGWCLFEVSLFGVDFFEARRLLLLIFMAIRAGTCSRWAYLRLGACTVNFMAIRAGTCSRFAYSTLGACTVNYCGHQGGRLFEVGLFKARRLYC